MQIVRSQIELCTDWS